MQLIIVRHGETDWTLTGQYTGTSELALTTHGREQASSLHHLLLSLLEGTTPAVYSSPRQRAIDTMTLALADVEVVVEPLIAEYDYGRYEGQTFEEVTALRPGWDLWRDGCPGGETTDQVAQRADRFLQRSVIGVSAPVVVFTHGHFSRILTARAIGIAPENGALFASAPASISTVGEHQGRPCVGLWNASADLIAAATVRD